MVYIWAAEIHLRGFSKYRFSKTKILKFVRSRSRSTQAMCHKDCSWPISLNIMIMLFDIYSFDNFIEHKTWKNKQIVIIRKLITQAELIYTVTKCKIMWIVEFMTIRIRNQANMLFIYPLRARLRKSQCCISDIIWCFEQ